jgi:predicted membrane chloride channel (bestrophin family)
MTLFHLLGIAIGFFIVSYLAATAYTRWHSMNKELHRLREDVRDPQSYIHQRIREIEKRAYTNYDRIYKELANLQENLERLQRKERKL